MAYGAEGANDMIPPNTTVIFEIEVLDWKSLYAPPKERKGKLVNRSIDVYKSAK